MRIKILDHQDLDNSNTLDHLRDCVPGDRAVWSDSLWPVSDNHEPFLIGPTALDEFLYRVNLDERTKKAGTAALLLLQGKGRTNAN